LLWLLIFFASFFATFQNLLFFANFVKYTFKMPN